MLSLIPNSLLQRNKIMTLSFTIIIIMVGWNVTTPCLIKKITGPLNVGVATTAPATPTPTALYPNVAWTKCFQWHALTMHALNSPIIVLVLTCNLELDGVLIVGVMASPFKLAIYMK